MISRVETGSVVMLHNIIIWFDGTIRPWRGHNQCSGRWEYDGQIHVHKCVPSGEDNE
jgi:hypothetical protein